jgi:hypothetical protein
VRRIHASRHFSCWLDQEGAFCYQGKDTADRGAQILDRITQVANGLRRARGSADPLDHEPAGAARADAFYALITRDTGEPRDLSTVLLSTRSVIRNQGVGIQVHRCDRRPVVDRTQGSGRNGLL